MNESPSDYSARRAEVERALADKAQDPAMARLHREMARRYEDIVTGPPVGRTRRESLMHATGFNFFGRGPCSIRASTGPV
jgi:hypothetical protein